MNKPLPTAAPASTAEAHVRWSAEYAAQLPGEREVRGQIRKVRRVSRPGNSADKQGL